MCCQCYFSLCFICHSFIFVVSYIMYSRVRSSVVLVIGLLVVFRTLKTENRIEVNYGVDSALKLNPPCAYSFVAGCTCISVKGIELNSTNNILRNKLLFLIYYLNKYTRCDFSLPLRLCFSFQFLIGCILLCPVFCIGLMAIVPGY